MKTPYYLIDETILDEDADRFLESMKEAWPNAVLSYSVKTNALPWLLAHYRKKGLLAEVVSAEEYELARRIGYPPEKIIYNGPIKDRAVFEEVLAGGGIVNLDSHDELRWMEEICGGEGSDPSARSGPPSADGRLFRVGLRVNCDLHRLCPGEVLADDEGSRFGFCYESGELKEVIGFLRSLPGAEICGLHLHSSTKSRSVQCFAAIAALACEVAEEFGLDLSYVDMGGGYAGGIPGHADCRDYMPAIAGVLRTRFDPARTALFAEPGISLLSRGITLVTSVLDVKHIREHTYVVTDGSRFYLNPQVTRRVYPHHNEAGKPRKGAADFTGREILPAQMVCGSSCMEYDRLFEEKDAPAFRPGDRIIYDLAGGYTMALVPLFIHYPPAVYVRRKDGTLITARDPWTNDEFLRKNHWEEP